MKKIFYKKILCKISLIILPVLLGIAEPSFGMGDNQLTSLVDTGVDVNVDADLQGEDMIGKILDQVQDDKNRQDDKDTDVNIDIDMDIQDNRLLLKPGASPIGDGSTSSPRARQLDGALPEPVEGCEFQKRSNDICDGKIRSFEPDEKLSSFYSEYIAKYYPKAYVIRQKFLDMTPDQVAEALNDIVHVFTKEPWFYFQNSPKGFRLIYYWEYVVDQCGIIHDFLKHAKVDLKTKKITFENGFAWDDFAGYFNYQDDVLIPKSQTLLSYLQKNNISSYTAFFALAFDYHVKFFNEGILLKNLNIANKYFSEIEYILEKLRNTPKEADYYETTKTCKELLGILKKKLGIDNLNNLGKTESEGTSDASNYYKEFTELNDVV